MSGTNRLVNSMNAMKNAGKSALDSALENANEVVLRMKKK